MYACTPILIRVCVQVVEHTSSHVHHTRAVQHSNGPDDAEIHYYDASKQLLNTVLEQIRRNGYPIVVCVYICE